jgi:hypothetical protein
MVPATVTCRQSGQIYKEDIGEKCKFSKNIGEKRKFSWSGGW